MSEHLKQIALRYARDGKGTVWMRECHRCGNLRWTSTYPNDVLEVKIEGSLEVFECEPCSYVAGRYPELFQWIGAVVGKAMSVKT